MASPEALRILRDCQVDVSNKVRERRGERARARRSRSLHHPLPGAGTTPPPRHAPTRLPHRGASQGDGRLAWRADQASKQLLQRAKEGGVPCSCAKSRARSLSGSAFNPPSPVPPLFSFSFFLLLVLRRLWRQGPRLGVRLVRHLHVPGMLGQAPGVGRPPVVRPVRRRRGVWRGRDGTRR